MAESPKQTPSEGISLANLPGNVLLRIAWPFKVREWAKGPAQTCHKLYRMQLPRVVVEDPGEKVLERRYQLFQSLRWGVKRMGACTFTLELRAQHNTVDYSMMDFIHRSGLKEILSDKACNLRCFTFEPLTLWPSDTPELQQFQGWVLEQMQRLEALQVPQDAPLLGAFASRLQHLKHLEVEAQAFVEGVSRNAGQLLPSLETLCLRRGDILDSAVNMLGCQRLRHLVVECNYVQAVLHDPNCQLGLHVHGLALSFSKSKPLGEGRRSLGATTDCVGARDYGILPPPHARRPHFAYIETLSMAWPLPWDEHINHKYNGDFKFADVEGILGRCMSIHAQSLRNLKALYLAIWPLQQCKPCYLPKGLSNLEELVIWKARYVVFEDPFGLFSTLKTFYIYGFPFNTNIDGSDMCKISSSLARRGLLLERVHRIDDSRSTLCLYLRPHTVRKLFVSELYELVERLATQGRCGACFKCLRRAGCLTY